MVGPVKPSVSVIVLVIVRVEAQEQPAIWPSVSRAVCCVIVIGIVHHESIELSRYI